MNTTLIVILIYMTFIVAIALISTKKRAMKEADDYLLAGRNLGTWMLAGTLAAAEIGGGSTVGVAAKAYGSWGLSAGWYVLCAGIGIFLVSFVAPYLRRAMASTIPEILHRRYGKEAHIVATLLSIIAGFIAAAVQVIATASIISVVTGLSMQTALLLSGVVVTFYTMLGGLVSVAMTDIIHIFFIIVGMMIAMPIIVNNAGGWEHVKSLLQPEQLEVTKVGYKSIIGLILLYFMTFSTGQEAVQRYFAAKDERVAKRGSFLCSCFMGIYGFIPAVIGLVALAYFPNINENQALATAATNFLHPVMSGVVLAAVCAATLSSAAGNMIAVSALFTNDVYKRYIKQDASGKEMIFISKSVILFTGVVSIIIALSNTTIIPLLVFAFTLRSAGPFAALIFGLMYKNVTKRAGIWSIVIASIVAFVWQYLGEPFGIMAIVLGAGVSVVVLLLISKIEISLGVKPAPSVFEGIDTK